MNHSLDEVAAANIRKLLKDADVRQNQLAIAVRLSPTEMSERMTGKRSFELDVLEDIAQVLDVNLLGLLGIDELIRLDPPPRQTSVCGGAIRVVREAAGLSIEQGAQLIGTSVKYLSGVETNKYAASPRWLGMAAGVFALHIKEHAQAQAGAR